MENCLVCKSKNVSINQNIDVNKIINLYKKDLNINITNEVKNISKIKHLVCKDCSFSTFKPMLNGSAAFYEKLQKLENNYYSEIRQEFLFAKTFIANNNSVLEVGSGSGNFAELINVKDYVGLEFNDEAIKKASEKNIKLEKKTIEEFVLVTDKKFDIICSFHVLEHVTNPFEFIHSKVKMLSNKGKIIIAVPNDDSFLIKNCNHTLNMPPHHVSRWNKKTFEKIASTFNLNMEAVLYTDVADRKKYFENKILYYLFGKKIVTSAFYFYILKILIKLNRKLNLYKLDKSTYLGNNIMVVLSK